MSQLSKMFALVLFVSKVPSLYNPPPPIPKHSTTCFLILSHPQINVLVPNQTLKYVLSANCYD